MSEIIAIRDPVRRSPNWVSMIGDKSWRENIAEIQGEWEGEGRRRRKREMETEVYLST